MKLAIIGSGISGAVAAHCLHTDHDITLFEAADYVGGHTHTVDVPAGNRSHAIDTGFVVFNDWTYPNFVGLLDALGVASRPTSMSFSVRNDATGLEYNGSSLNGLFAQRRNLLRPGFYRMLADIVRFNRQAPRCEADLAPDATVGSFLDSHGYSRQFAESYLLPMGAAIWSCPVGVFAEFPIRFIIEFYRNHGLLSVRRRPTWRVVEGGSRTYMEALTRPFADRIRLSTPVIGVQRSLDGVKVRLADAPPESFEHVIFACHSDQALKILGSGATPIERELLSAFPYSRNVAVLHTDTSLLPRSRRAWACWTYHVRGKAADSPVVTYNMNMLQGIDAPQTYCVTLNDEQSIAPERVIRQMVYHHPIFTNRRAAAQARHHQLLGPNHTSYCGAYWGNGFHEAGVNSALAVVDALRASGDQRATDHPARFDRRSADSPAFHVRAADHGAATRSVHP